jgi:hypothetical protein
MTDEFQGWSHDHAIESLLEILVESDIRRYTLGVPMILSDPEDSEMGIELQCPGSDFGEVSAEILNSFTVMKASPGSFKETITTISDDDLAEKGDIRVLIRITLP